MADSKDPVAQRLSWQPLRPGGANFKTRQLISELDTITLKPSLLARFLAWCFLLPGLFVLLAIAPELIIKGQWFKGLFLLLWGLLFGAAGAIQLLLAKRFTIDRARGVYFFGKCFQEEEQLPRSRQGRLNEIYAVQIIRERVRARSRKYGPHSFWSYELNLVFADGERVNILDHGKEPAVDAAARAIANALAIPAWKAGYQDTER
ncbi:hypothetical protein [Halioxenophilus sp. WMMB6]|uniref:hypothetical protein n=1 Tax=Halioxenophilus sp. WMMB6 TaxID=3073815 RepID=UPI00295ED7B4|nr:hypothetical protein [Halioxenophilus sp. WMMB6]